MSKESFSKTISETMYKKLRNIEDNDFDSFFSNDENFILALCLSYMTLSKEKIIDKDMKNKDRMARLTQMVDTSEINKVFTPGFAEEMPTITYAKENNNLWILDNIRDSIMHGVFDIDEERKCFIINNTQFDRELVAEIPFSWFISYAKNDILSKKELDNYTIRGFYYNKEKKDRKFLDTQKELVNNIQYRVNIKGSKFNIRDIEKRIKELFDIYSKKDISDEIIEQYRSELSKEKIKYNEKYLVSFYIARKKIKEIIEKEFPNTNIKIFVDNNKQKLSNKVSKRMMENYDNYDLMFETFNKLIAPKGISLIQYISNIIEEIEENNKLDSNSKKSAIDVLKKILEVANNDNPLSGKNLNILRSICLNVYGLSTLVINHENLYKQHFLNTNPSVFGIRACSKKPYLEYANKSKSIIMKILDSEIKLFRKKEQLIACTNGQIKTKIQQDINLIMTEISQYESDLDSLMGTLKYDEVIKYEDVDDIERQKLKQIIQTYYKHFNEASTVEAKRKIKKLIGSLLDLKRENESKYTYGYCNNMEDALTIIRNSFSHVGRIFMGKDKGEETTVVLNDYDSNNEKSGIVTCRYNDLIELLESPYEFSKQKSLN